MKNFLEGAKIGKNVRQSISSSAKFVWKNYPKTPKPHEEDLIWFEINLNRFEINLNRFEINLNLVVFCLFFVGCSGSSPAASRWYAQRAGPSSSSLTAGRERRGRRLCWQSARARPVRTASRKGHTSPWQPLSKVAWATDESVHGTRLAAAPA